METLIITPDQVNAWRIPPFQRPIKVNAKVQEIAEEMKPMAAPSPASSLWAD
jgi:hypothetical protein